VSAAPAVHERVRGELVRIAHRGLGVQQLAPAATRALRRAVPFEGTCLLTVDPATLLPTAEIVQGGLPAEATARLTEIELGEPDFTKFTELARSPSPAASLSGATGGEPDRSLRQRELRRPHGFADELRSVLPGPTGVWGALTLLRAAGSPDFTPAEVRFVASVAGLLADGLRRAALLQQTIAGPDDAESGLLVLAVDDSLEMTNRSAMSWLEQLGAGPGGRLPVVVRAIAGRARRAAAGDGAEPARARVRTRTGRWVLVQGSVLDGDGGDGPAVSRVAVLVEPARAPELAPLIAAAHGFTERERLVTELVAQGFSSRAIADRLHLSAYTVQDHLKAIFEKSGTGSRGELVARLFVDGRMLRLSGKTGLPSAARRPD
jgi:DNA-binding CsgD family transcriptional regulator